MPDAMSPDEAEAEYLQAIDLAVEIAKFVRDRQPDRDRAVLAMICAVAYIAVTSGVSLVVVMKAMSKAYVDARIALDRQNEPPGAA